MSEMAKVKIKTDFRKAAKNQQKTAKWKQQRI
jgi:hypothetical protein